MSSQRTPEEIAAEVVTTALERMEAHPDPLWETDGEPEAVWAGAIVEAIQAERAEAERLRAVLDDVAQALRNVAKAYHDETKHLGDCGWGARCLGCVTRKAVAVRVADHLEAPMPDKYDERAREIIDYPTDDGGLPGSRDDVPRYRARVAEELRNGAAALREIGEERDRLKVNVVAYESRNARFRCADHPDVVAERMWGCPDCLRQAKARVAELEEE